MPRPDTFRSPAEILRVLGDKLRQTFIDFQNARPGDVEADKRIKEDLRQLNVMLDRLDVSFLSKVKQDASTNQQDYQKLVELEKLCEEIAREKIQSIREDHYIHKVARRARGMVRGQKGSAKRKGKKLEKQATKKAKDAMKEKAVAASMTGKKR
ncbi:hypothetical protein GOV09_05065 [Candidatus Woesearchaeota archaeon]|nr:hypothetical protein [Candidatus Woesearchaeota archaeon]